MSKHFRAERILYIVISLAFLLAGIAPVMKVKTDAGVLYYSYYRCVFSDCFNSVFANVFLAIPAVMTLLVAVLLFSELLNKKFNPSLEWACRMFVIFFAIFGFLFASLADNLLPFGLVILGFSLLYLINAIVFHYGIKGQNI